MPFDDEDERELEETAAPMTNLVVRVPVALKERLGTLAERRGIKDSRLVRYILKIGVKDLEKKWGLAK